MGDESVQSPPDNSPPVVQREVRSLDKPMEASPAENLLEVLEEATEKEKKSKKRRENSAP